MWAVAALLSVASLAHAFPGESELVNVLPEWMGTFEGDKDWPGSHSYNPDLGYHWNVFGQSADAKRQLTTPRNDGKAHSGCQHLACELSQEYSTLVHYGDSFVKSQELFQSFWVRVDADVDFPIVEADTWPYNHAVHAADLLMASADGSSTVSALQMHVMSKHGANLWDSSITTSHALAFIARNDTDWLYGTNVGAWPPSGAFFELPADEWVRVTLNVKMNSHARVYINDELKIDWSVYHFTAEDPASVPADTTDPDPAWYLSQAKVGQVGSRPQITPSGTIRFDDVTLHTERIEQLYVSPDGGHRSNDGLTRQTPLRSVQDAVSRANPGTTVNLLPGVYRQTTKVVVPPGRAGAPVTIQAADGPDTVHYINSRAVPAANWQTWQEHTGAGGTQPRTPKPGFDLNDVLVADLSGLGIPADQIPFKVGFVDSAGAYREVSEPDDGTPISPGARALTRAREPNLDPRAWPLWRQYWMAQGGASVATACEDLAASSFLPFEESNYNTNCKPSYEANRSPTQLTDGAEDTFPPEEKDRSPGHLGLLPSIVGATLRLMHEGGYRWRETEITAHSGATITFNALPGDPGQWAGWGRKYIVDNHFSLLDAPGEWWFDKTTGLLYIVPLSAEHSQQLRNGEVPLEVAFNVDKGFELGGSGHLVFKDLNMAFFKNVFEYWRDRGTDYPGRSSGYSFENLSISHCKSGIAMSRVMPDVVSWPGQELTHVTVTNSEFRHTDDVAVLVQSYNWPNPLRYAGVRSVKMTGNTFFRTNLRSEYGSGAVQLGAADRVVFADNIVSQVGGTGLRIERGLVDPTLGDKYTGYTRPELQVGDVLVQNNLIEDVGGLFGGVPGIQFDKGVFRDALVRGNKIRYVVSLTWFDVLKGRNWVGQRLGINGAGVQISAGGVTVADNMIYGARAGIQTGGAINGTLHLFDNVIQGTAMGIMLYHDRADQYSAKVRPAVDLQEDLRIVNNVISGCADFAMGIYLYLDGCNVMIDNNVYDRNGWQRPWSSDIYQWDPEGDAAGLSAIRTLGQNQDLSDLFRIYHDRYSVQPEPPALLQKPTYAVSPVNPDDWHVITGVTPPWDRRVGGLESMVVDELRVNLQPPAHPADRPAILSRTTDLDSWLLPPLTPSSAVPALSTCGATPHRAAPTTTDGPEPAQSAFGTPPGFTFPTDWSTGSQTAADAAQADKCFLDLCDELFRPCRTGSLCLQGKCHKKDGQVCTADSECITGCLNGVCGVFSGCYAEGVWPQTQERYTASEPCSKTFAGYVGTQTRYCQGLDVWLEPDTSNCIACPAGQGWPTASAGDKIVLACGEGMVGDKSRLCTEQGWDIPDLSSCRPGTDGDGDGDGDGGGGGGDGGGNGDTEVVVFYEVTKILGWPVAFADWSQDMTDAVARVTSSFTDVIAENIKVAATSVAGGQETHLDIIVKVFTMAEAQRVQALLDAWDPNGTDDEIEGFNEVLKGDPMLTDMDAESQGPSTVFSDSEVQPTDKPAAEEKESPVLFIIIAAVAVLVITSAVVLTVVKCRKMKTQPTAKTNSMMYPAQQRQHAVEMGAMQSNPAVVHARNVRMG